MSVVQLIDVPRINVGDWFEELFDWITTNLGWLFDAFSTVIEGAVDTLVTILEGPDAVVLSVVFAALGLLVRGWKFALVALVGLVLIIGMDQWVNAMETLALVLVATVVAVVIGIPLGVLAARSKRASAVLRPILDLMQTMPAFVWLVPVVFLFGIGYVPGVVATIIFALPPGVRLTELGIRTVDAEVVEAAHAFGSTPRQTLFGVQLPLAMPTIMAGVNQVIMLALSMAVIAGLVGAGGLGGEVTAAIATGNLGLAFEAGLSVVILAVYLDRVTAAFGAGGVLGRLRRKQAEDADEEVITDETEHVEAGESGPALDLPTKIGA
jgi:ABC-type proline/glycine betaine transport system permease subunit